MNKFVRPIAFDTTPGIGGTPEINISGTATGMQAAPETIDDLDKGSIDYNAMCPYFEKVAAIIAGRDAMVATGKKYLPKFPHEGVADYRFRLENAKFTNVYRDIIENLSAKPFSVPVSFPTSDDKEPGSAVPSEIADFIENVDGAGTDITVFAVDTFFNAINSAIDWIFVDYTKAEPEANGRVRTIAEEQALGLRPFWTHIRAINVLEVKTDFFDGTQALSYIRILEPGTPVRVRVIERDGSVVTWTLYEKRSVPNRSKQTFVPIDQGLISIGVIPLVPIATGRRNGNTWQFFPPMQDAADLQIELYQAESGLKNIKTLAGFPMLAGNGVTPPLDERGKPKDIPIGPMAALYAPSNGNGSAGSWTLLEPAATSMTFLSGDVKDTISQLRELGRQPLTAQSGNLTVIAASVAGQKGNTAVQMWAHLLKAALDNALKITAMWLKTPDTFKPNIHVFTDFNVDAGDKNVLETLNAMRAAGDLSQLTLWGEMKRRAVLKDDFNAEAEKKRLDAEALEETPGDGFDNDPANALPPPKPGDPKPPIPPAPGNQPPVPAPKPPVPVK